MSTENDVQDFIKRLDDLLRRYQYLINMDFDKECLRLMKLQEMKYKEKISSLEAKLRITKMKLKFETDLRRKSEEKHALSNLNSILTSNDNFITATNSLVLAENDLNESNLLPSSFRKHRANNSSFDSESDSNVSFSGVSTCKISSKTSNRFAIEIKSADISYLGFEKLKEKHLSELDKSSEPSPVKNMDLPSEMKYSDSSKVLVNNGSEKITQSQLETFKGSPTKLSSISYFSPKKESTPFRGKSCLNASRDHCHLYESSNNERSISRLAPLIPPMIPMAVIHCIDEIEKRGLKEIGLYRMAGDEKDIMNLGEKFEDFETNVDLSEINIHSVAAFLKSFLCNFPLIPKPFHDTFAQVIIENDKDDLYYAVSGLPQANRDTLAYLIIHLRRVSCSTLCKMPASRLSVVFGPIVFGVYICDKENQFSDVPICVMEELLKLPSSYWNSFIVDPTSSETPTKLRNSPTTELIVHKKATKYFSTNVPKKKFFK